MNAKTTLKGFTLIELLIVIGIIAILAAVVLLTLNPAELLRQARDSTRISDFDSVRSAMALYIVDVASPDIGIITNCYVAQLNTPAIFGVINPGCDSDDTGVYAARFNGGATVVDATTPRNVDSNGWIPVNFTQISAGSPLPALPIDPTNSTLYFYAYRPGAGTTYELNANMESAKFRPNETTDGGDRNGNLTDGTSSDGLYEVGTDQLLDL